MRPGETLESAIWLDGCETQADLLLFKRDVVDAIEQACTSKHLRHGPVRFVEKKPGTDRVPPVPDHIQGLDVRLLVGEADIVGYAPVATSRTFVGELERKDLDRLRAITREAYRKSNPGKTLTDLECDDVIEALGPDTALKTLRSGVN